MSEFAKEFQLNRTVVLVGLMGAGKSTVGRRLADALDVGFVDSDDEIEAAAGMSIPDIFDTYGEQHFRDGETRVIGRLLERPAHILATGGGAFIADENRREIKKHAVSVWINADINTLWERVQGKPGRPLLQRKDARAVLEGLANTRYPIYAQADITVESKLGQPHEKVMKSIIDALLAQDVLSKKEY